MARPRPGFSMISLLVVLGILAFASALFLSFIGQVRRAALRTQGTHHQMQLALAVHNYHDVHGGLPPLIGKQGDLHATAHQHILPYLEQEPLFRKGREDPAWTRQQVVSLFLDPADTSAPARFVYRDWLATTNYPGNWLMFRDGGITFANIADGTSNAIMFAQRYQLCNGQPTAWAYDRLHYWAPMYGFYSRAKFQTAPKAEDCDPALPQAIFPEGIVTAFGDGSVRMIADRVSPLTWSHLTDPADGFAIMEDF